MVGNLQDQRSFQILLWKAVMLPLLLALLLAGLFFIQVRNMKNAAQAVNHSNVIISETRRLEGLVIDAQTGIRGYLITSNVEYLKPYQNSLLQRYEEFQNLKQQVSRRSEQLEIVTRLESKVNDWFEYTAVLLKKRMQKGARFKFNPSRNGEVLMTAIRVEFNRLTELETKNRDARSHDADEASRFALTSGLGLSLLIGLTLAFSTRRVLLGISKTYAEAFGRLEKLATDLESALKLRDEFLSIASHELKTPLTSLKLNLQMTQRGMREGVSGLPDPSKLKRSIEVSINQVSRLDGLIGDLLDISSIQAGKLKLNFERIDLSKLLIEASERCQNEFEKADCKLVLEVEPDIQVECDSFRIEQVVLNLITNATKYAPGKPIVIGLRSAGDLAQFYVSDQGIGIEDEKQTLVFERFERVPSVQNISGLGLGLYIVKKIVSSHLGSIDLKSALGKGSTFTVNLPLKQVRPSFIATAEQV